MIAAELRQLARDVQLHVPEVAAFFCVVPLTLVDDEAWGKLAPGAKPTACVDATGMYFAESFISKLPVAKQRGLILHEVMHLARYDRSATVRRAEESPLTALSHHRLANIAQDHIIEMEINALGIPAIECNHTPQQLKRFTLAEGWRSIYAKLLEEAEKKGQAQPNGEVDHHPGAVMSDEADAASAAELEAFERAIDEAKKIAEEMKRGNASINTPRAVGDAQPTVDWRDVLRHVLPTERGRGGHSWARVDKRAFAQGRLKMGVRKAPDVRPRLCVLVDASGSMHSELPRAIADVFALIDTRAVASLSLGFYDTTLLRWMTDVDPSTLNPKDIPHGGGTNVAGVLHDMVAGDMLTPTDFVIVLTDGEDNFILDAATRAELGAFVWLTYRSAIRTNHGITINIGETT